MKKIITLLLLAGIAMSSPAQDMQDMHHMHHMMPDMDHSPAMYNNLSLSLPMSQQGSGTGWQPVSTPVNAYMLHTGNWSSMIMGSIYLRYTDQRINQHQSRAGARFDAPNWLMFMTSRQVGKNGLFTFNSMLSLDPLTEGGKGYPLLFQSGESYRGKPLVDDQHPHDLFAELSVSYAQRINKDMDVYGYIGYPGEPALGPQAFMHRLSAANDPDATLGHHWQDATHITFGVATLGIRYKLFKLEGSSFTGREPDEHRYGFDRPRFDSYSYRLWVNPSDNWSFQFSQGYIHSPEALEPEHNVRRTTASAMNVQHFSAERYLATSLIYGHNHALGEGKENSVTLEGNLTLKKLAVYTRYEFVQKSAEELQISSFPPAHRFNVNAWTLGLSRQLFSYAHTNAALGLQTTLNFPDKALQTVYGSFPMAGEVFIRIYPGIMDMKM